MGDRQHIVVTRAPKRVGYRDGAHRGPLVLEQVGLGRAGVAGVATAAVLGVVTGAACLLAAPSLVVAGCAVAVGSMALGLGRWIDLARRAQGANVRLVVAERALRVFRPGDAPQPVSRLHVSEIATIELRAMDLEIEDWELVVVGEGRETSLLRTGSRKAGLRVLSLILDRLVADGAFEDLPMSTAPCPSCRTKLVAPARWLPITFACGECGTEGTLTH